MKAWETMCSSYEPPLVRFAQGTSSLGASPLFPAIVDLLQSLTLLKFYFVSSINSKLKMTSDSNSC